MRRTTSGPSAVQYWAPQRSGDSGADYRRGQCCFHEAVDFCLRSGLGSFLSCVLIAMSGYVGSMEAGFIDALLDRTERGAMPPPLSEEQMLEVTGSADGSEFRKLESEARSTIEFSKVWGPDALYIFTMCCLTGREGPNIAGAMTMIARTALNGSRN